jgi:hypothetical protein
MFNAAIIVKLKKMYNNIRKYYELNMYRSFLLIEKFSRSKHENNESSRNSSNFVKNSEQKIHNNLTNRKESHKYQY